MRIWITLTLALAGLAAPAAADAERGAELARRWCTPCHVVAADEPGGDAGPSFMAMRAGRSEPGLRAWLFQPHPPMPDLALTAAEIDAILAYIRALPAPGNPEAEGEAADSE
ncbi:MAG TPA: cytochrome c [Thermohalobaculum sp.]|nr:cytochrome c [Thermohalobaculum sp.]